MYAVGGAPPVSRQGTDDLRLRKAPSQRVVRAARSAPALGQRSDACWDGNDDCAERLPRWSVIAAATEMSPITTWFCRPRGPASPLHRGRLQQHLDSFRSWSHGCRGIARKMSERCSTSSFDILRGPMRCRRPASASRRRSQQRRHAAGKRARNTISCPSSSAGSKSRRACARYPASMGGAALISFARAQVVVRQAQHREARTIQPAYRAGAGCIRSAPTCTQSLRRAAIAVLRRALSQPRHHTVRVAEASSTMNAFPTDPTNSDERSGCRVRRGVYACLRCHGGDLRPKAHAGAHDDLHRATSHRAFART